MKKGIDKGSVSDTPLTNMKPFAKMFVINTHFGPLEDFDLRLAGIIQSGSCPKIVALKPFDDTVQIRQVIQAIEAARKEVEGKWDSLPADLGSDIWAHWMKDKNTTRKNGTARDSEVFSEEHVEVHSADGLKNDTSGKYADDGEEMHRSDLLPRLIPISDINVLFNELRNRELLFADYFLVIFCRNPLMPLIKDLLRLGVSLSAIIHLIPCPIQELEAQLPTLHDDLQEFQMSDDTKHIGLFTSHVNAELLMDSNPSEIYEQLKTYLFDIELLSQHFLIYQSEFLEINDSQPSKETLTCPLHVQTSKECSDNTAVCVYFDNLCRMVEAHTFNERRYSSFHPRPFLDNGFNKIIIEDANDLLKSAIATQMKMVSYWKAVDIVINAIPQNQTHTHCSLDSVKLPLYKELLSWEAFAQRLDMVKGEYDRCCRKDLSEKFKLFVFRRTFHKILESTRRFHLPTRVCFRDFCNYTAPTYVEVLRRRNEGSSHIIQESDTEEDVSTSSTNFASSQNGDYGQDRETYFSGLTFADTFQELTVTERVYRFHRTGCIRVKLENWLHKDRKLTVQINLFKCVIYAHHWDKGSPMLFPRVRLIANNGITCNVEMSEDPAKTYTSIQWPNDCQIRYVCENGVGGVEQRYYWSSAGEYKRVYTNRGCVLVYLTNGDINVLTPNGIFYQLYPNFENTEQVSPAPEMTSTNVSIELEFVRSLRSYGIDCRCFDVTKNDGRKIRVLDGVAIEERARYLVYEWMDLGYGEMFAERDDGVKLISSYYGLKTYYPCGTMIHTVTEEEYIELDLDCRSPSTENILRKINPDIIKWLDERRVQRELWLSFNLTYHVRHERFASITCYNATKMIIQSPGGVKVTVTGDTVLIDVGFDVSLRFTPDLCNITSSHDNDMSIKLHLIPNDDDILCYQSATAKVILNDNGQLISDDDFIPDEPYDEDLYFLTKQYKFGIAFIPEYEFHSLLNKYKRTPFFYETDKKVVVLKNVLPINVRFSMPIPGMDENLDKLFITKCRHKPRERFQTEQVFSARTIIKLECIPKDLCDFLRRYGYIEMTLSDNIQDALDHWFGEKKTKEKYSPAWEDKIKATKKEMQENKKRAPIYHAMIQYKVFPKYHEFLAAGCNVDHVNLKKLIPGLAKKGFKVVYNFTE